MDDVWFGHIKSAQASFQETGQVTTLVESLTQIVPYPWAVGLLRPPPRTLGNGFDRCAQNGQVDKIPRANVPVGPSIRIGQELLRETVLDGKAGNRRPVRANRRLEIDTALSNEFDPQVAARAETTKRETDAILIGANIGRCPRQCAFAKERLSSIPAGQCPQLGVARGVGADEVDVSRQPILAELENDASSAREAESAIGEEFGVEPGQTGRYRAVFRPFPDHGSPFRSAPRVCE